MGILSIDEVPQPIRLGRLRSTACEVARLTNATQKENGTTQTEYKEYGSYGNGTLAVASIYGQGENEALQGENQA
jgi:hypothetical protein